ncbi:glycosyltransferase [Leuconostoc mesenteroides subsp. jonggajibkimchii]|uniref:glycosyltransferase n=1 Tax=Leuconostoc mesenteroides TaxID=1245 RepID=UPI003CED2A38
MLQSAISLRRLRLQNFKSKLGMNMTMRHIGVVTRLVQGKRVDEAIKAFALITEKYPNYTFDVYGSGDEESELKELVKQLGLEERVRFMGYVSDTDTVYQKLDFTVMTSEHEGFALSVLESIANGTPVISYPVKYGPSSIIDGIAGRVTNTRNVNELADLMKKEIEHPTSRLIVSQRAKFYSFEKYKENWLKVLS